MSNNETRLAATGVIWLAFTVTMVAAMVTGVVSNSGGYFLIGFALLIAGTASATQAVWKYGGSDTREVAEKTKRRSHVDRLLERMDEAELNELRARLMAEPDGEAVSLNELLAERERRRP